MASELEETLESMTDTELVGILAVVLSHTEYKSGDYTPMMQSMVDAFPAKNTLSEKQKNAIRGHLRFNKKLWW